MTESLRPNRAYCLATLCCAAASLLSTTTATAQANWYVNAAAPAGGNGTSWTQAFNSLDQALNAVGSGEEIWVAAGRYRTRQRTVATDPRSATFDIRGDITVAGGFDGTETTFSQRAGLFEQTILTGEIGAPGTFDNAYHVVTYSNRPTPLVLDGFRIEGGNAVGATGANAMGGGIYMSNAWMLTLANSTITGNRAESGAGIGGLPGAYRIHNCRITRNYAKGDGGGLFVQAGSVKMWNTVLQNNASGARGGAVFLRSTAAINLNVTFQKNEFMNCLFSGNRAATKGGAAFLGAGNVLSSGVIVHPGSGRFTNCTFTANFAGVAGGSIHANNNTPLPTQCLVANCISWGNSAPTGPELLGDIDAGFSDIGGGWPGMGNLNVDPQFRNVASSDFHLAGSSPARNAGSNGLVTFDFFDLDGNGVALEPTPVDLDATRRIANGTVDMGCYEVRPGK